MDNKNSPHGQFHRFLFPFFSKFSDLNFASCVLYNLPILCHVSHTVSLGYLWLDFQFKGCGFKSNRGWNFENESRYCPATSTCSPHGAMDQHVAGGVRPMIAKHVGRNGKIAHSYQCTSNYCDDFNKKTLRSRYCMLYSSYKLYRLADI